MKTKTKTRVAYDIAWQNSAPIVTIHDENGAEPVLVRNLLGNGDTNTKLRKTSKILRTYGLSMLAADHGGTPTVCAFASAGCSGACLDHQGLGSVFESIYYARLARKILWFAERQWFLDRLTTEVANKTRNNPAPIGVRLNVFSDIAWERYAPWIFDDNPSTHFWDYTKNPTRVGLLRPNYWVTFSRSEKNEAKALELLGEAKNVTVVFDTGCVSNATARGLNEYGLPKTWRGYPVIDGDETDARFDDPRGRTRGRVVGLLLKAASHEERRKAVDSGFAVKGARIR